MGKKAKIEELRRKKSLDHSVSDGVAWSVMAGAGDEYLSPYAIHLGASNLEIGLLSSLPGLVASLAQLKTPALVEKSGNRKRIIVTNVFLHALMWAPIVLIPLVFRSFLGLILIIFTSIKAFFGGLPGPAWASLMGDLVPAQERGKYFGFRNKIVLATFLLASLSAGFFLNIFTKETLVYGFITLFLIAMLFRFISLYYLNKMYEPKLKIDKKRDFTFFDFLKNAYKNNFGRFSLYLALLLLATSIAGPFFTVFMLRDLKFSYLQYAIVHTTPAIVSFLILPWTGRLIDRLGTVRLIRMSGFLIPIVPLLWLLSTKFYFLVLVEIFSGFVWTIFNLCVFTFVFDTVRTPQVRTFCIAYSNVLNGVAIFIGATIGGLLVTYVLKNTWLFVSALQIIFLISGLVRLLVTLVLLPQIKEERHHIERGPILDVTGLLRHVGSTGSINMFNNWILRELYDVRTSFKYLEDDVLEFSSNITKIVKKRIKKKYS